MTGLRWTEDQLREHQARVAGRTRVIDRDSEAHTSGSARDGGPPPVKSSFGPADGEQVGGKSPSKIKRKRPEEDLQKQQVKFLTWALMPPWRFLHIPNQKGTRSTWENRLLKALGVQEGAADILFLGPGARFVWIENKSDIGQLSEAQEGWRDWCFATGAQWYLCRSLNDMVEACIDAGIPLRGRPS